MKGIETYDGVVYGEFTSTGQFVPVKEHALSAYWVSAFNDEACGVIVNKVNLLAGSFNYLPDTPLSLDRA